MNITSLIVTYNRLDKLKKTILATLALPFNYVVVVDNASSDGTSEWLKEQNDERLIIISSRTNSGGAGGFKYGSEWVVKNLKTDWILFYDDDAYPANNFFDVLNKVHINEKVIYACNVVDFFGNRCGMNIPWKKYPKGLYSNLKYIMNSDGYISNGRNDESIISLSFVGMLIGIDNLKKYYIHIDESLFIYFDDVYFSYYIHLDKVSMMFNSDAIIIHDINSNNRYMASWKIYYLIRNMLLARHKFGKNSPFDKFYLSLRLFKYFILSVKHPERYQCIKYYFKGLYDGMRNRKREG